MAEKIWTKDAERNQLRKIAELIDETEPGSYIRMSFSGIIAMCEQNIAEDACNNMPDRLEIREKRIAELEAELRAKDSECGDKILRLEHENQALQTHLDEAQEKLKLAEKQAEEWENSAHAAGDLYCGLEAECKLKDECIAENEKRIAEHDAEIIRLKAKLFDYMEKEREQNGKA